VRQNYQRSVQATAAAQYTEPRMIGWLLRRATSPATDVVMTGEWFVHTQIVTTTLALLLRVPEVILPPIRPPSPRIHCRVQERLQYSYFSSLRVARLCTYHTYYKWQFRHYRINLVMVSCLLCHTAPLSQPGQARESKLCTLCYHIHVLSSCSPHFLTTNDTA